MSYEVEVDERGRLKPESLKLTKAQLSEVRMSWSQAERGGRPAHKPTEATRAVAMAFATGGAPKVSIAHYLGISIPTLDKYYSDEMERGVTEANAMMGLTMFEKGVNERDTNAVKFWLECRAGWKRASDEISSKQANDMLEEMQQIRKDLNKQYEKEY